jgi:predicted nucleotidyltransferase component of viral defense system
MIPKAYITEWSKNAPWVNNYQVEQDLIIERALVELFSHTELFSQLAFRGGTALHKLYLKPQARYSEDIDLVQLHSGEIGPLLTLIRERLSFLGKANYNASEHNATLIFRFDSEYEPVIRLKLKVEINTREHFSVFNTLNIEHNLVSAYHSGNSIIKTFTIEELLGTKLRALYQRKKGRDLFDLWYANEKVKPDPEKIIEAFTKYISKESLSITSKDFIDNMEDKLQDKEFIGDISGLLRPGINYNISVAWAYLKQNILSNI